MKSQFWSSNKLKEYQFDALYNLLNHAYSNCEYYRKLFDDSHIRPQDIKSLQDIKKIPSTNKKKVLDNKDKIQNHINRQKHFYSETSGSTGEPLVFFRNQDWDAWHNASVLRGYSWYGINPWDRNGYLWGYNISLMRSFVIKIQDMLQNRFRLFTYEHDDIKKFCIKLKKAKFISGYSSMIYEIAKYIENESSFKNHINLKLIKGTSEKIYDSYQNAIRNAFGKKMISEYGAAEAGIIAFECPDGNMHINMETVIVEEVNGKILVTNLTSHSFPIIRYELGDYIVLDEKTLCTCGRKSTLLNEVTGRIGKKIYGKYNHYPSLTLYYVFKNIAINNEIVLNYQVIQRKQGHIKILIESKLTEHEKECLDAELVKYFKNDIEYDILEEQTFLNKNGKRRDFISEIVE